MYTASPTDAVITLTAKAGGVKTLPTATVEIEDKSGATAVTPTTNGVDGVTGVAAVYTITITTALESGDTLTIKNVADNDV